MNHFQQSHQTLISGIKRHYDELVSKYPEVEYQASLATLGLTVQKLCDSAVPKDDNEFFALCQAQTTVLSAMNMLENTLRRQKLWSHQPNVRARLV